MDKNKKSKRSGTWRDAIDIAVSQDKMHAFGTFVKLPEDEGGMSASALRAALGEMGVVYGVCEQALSDMLERREVGTEFELACGKEPVGGADGYLEFYFDVTAFDKKKPRILENGSVDYRQLRSVSQCKSGQALASVIMPDGENGMNVLGETLDFLPGNVPQLPAGKNVIKKGDSIVAGASGRIIMEDGLVCVLPVLELQGDVDASVGNLEFIGSIVISGGVKNGYSVKADEDIEVRGVVEAASLISGRNISLLGGVHGGGRALIKAGGDISAKFIESSTVNSSGSITAESIIHSRVNCDGVLSITKVLVGGKAVAGEKVSASTLGSAMSQATEVVVGNDPDLINEYKDLADKYQIQKKELEAASSAIENLNSRASIGELSQELKLKLVSALHRKMHLRDKLEITRKKLCSVLAKLRISEGSVRVSKEVKPGVKIVIGDAAVYIKANLKACLVTNEDGKIAIKQL
ncbi:MAG: FapA family protein [Clostridiales bacterium]|nr:FapA family protein [Clostridiales bacterium]